jgi:hypothetical protein
MIAEHKKPFRCKYMFRRPRAPKPLKEKVPLHDVRVMNRQMLEKMPVGLSFKQMDMIVRARAGGYGYELKHANVLRLKAVARH